MRQNQYSDTESRLRAALDLCPLIAFGLKNGRISQAQSHPMRSFVAWAAEQALADESLAGLVADLRAAEAKIPSSD